jgi:hypothetical protein
VLQALQLAHLHVSSFAADSIMGHLHYKLARDKADEMKAVIDELVLVISALCHRKNSWLTSCTLYVNFKLVVRFIIDTIPNAYSLL